MKGISRIDSRNTHGWFVRVFRNGQTHSKMFSDGVHGGREKALKIAKKYKDEYEEKNPRSYASTRLRLKAPRNNTSGVVGVSDTHVRSRSGELFPCFSVSWCPQKNTNRCKKFYYHKYDSREEAFEAAVKFRQEREREILEGLQEGIEPGKSEIIDTKKKRNVEPKRSRTIEVDKKEHIEPEKSEIIEVDKIEDMKKTPVKKKAMNPADQMLAFLKSRPMK